MEWKLNVFGHVCRKKGERPIKLWCLVSWKKQVRETKKKDGWCYTRMFRMDIAYWITQNREIWSKIVRTTVDTNGHWAHRPTLPYCSIPTCKFTMYTDDNIDNVHLYRTAGIVPVFLPEQFCWCVSSWQDRYACFHCPASTSEIFPLFHRLPDTWARTGSLCDWRV